MVSTTTAAFVSSRLATSAAMVSGVIDGQSPESTTSEPSSIEPLALVMASRAALTASPVPSCCVWMTIRVSPSTSGGDALAHAEHRNDVGNARLMGGIDHQRTSGFAQNLVGDLWAYRISYGYLHPPRESKLWRSCENLLRIGLVHSGRPFRTSVRAAAACFPRNLACVGNVFKLSLQTIFRQIAAKAQRSSLHDALDQGARARRVASKPYTWQHPGQPACFRNRSKVLPETLRTSSVIHQRTSQPASSSVQRKNRAAAGCR